MATIPLPHNPHGSWILDPGSVVTESERFYHRKSRRRGKDEGAYRVQSTEYRVQGKKNKNKNIGVFDILGTFDTRVRTPYIGKGNYRERFGTYITLPTCNAYLRYLRYLRYLTKLDKARGTEYIQ